MVDVFSTRVMFSQHGWCFLNTGDVFSTQVMFSQHEWCFLNIGDVFSTLVMFSQPGWCFLNTVEVVGKSRLWLGPFILNATRVSRKSRIGGSSVICVKVEKTTSPVSSVNSFYSKVHSYKVLNYRVSQKKFGLSPFLSFWPWKGCF